MVVGNNNDEYGVNDDVDDDECMSGCDDNVEGGGTQVPKDQRYKAY